METKKLSRRQFMQMGFAAVGGLAVVPVADALSPFSSGLQSLRIGVLMPQAQRFPQAAANVLDGLKLALAGNMQRVSLLTKESSPLQGATLDAARTLLESGIKVVIGMVGMAHVEALQSLFSHYDATLIVATAGESAIPTQHPNVFYNSLHYWQSAYAAGEWATRAHGKRGMLITSFVESGFDTAFAFARGIEAAGGSLVASKVTHISGNSANIADAIRLIQSTQPDFVYAAYQGEQASEFLTAYRTAGLRVPLISAAFMAEAAAYGATTIGAWAPTASIPANARFMSDFRHSTGRLADAFAALGFETASWLAGALHQCGGDLRALRHSLTQAEVHGPRGALSFDASTATLTSALKVHVGSQQTKLVEHLSTPQVSLNPQVQTGWTFSYLSA